MKTTRTAFVLAVAAFAASTVSPGSAQAQSITGSRGELAMIPVYQIQVLYATPRSTGGHGHYGGYGTYRYTYTWVTIAETENLAEADFILDLYELALELGVLDEVAPPRWNSFPIDVQMLTTYRPITKGGVLTTNLGSTAGPILKSSK